MKLNPVVPAADLDARGHNAFDEDSENFHPVVELSHRDEYDMRGSSEEDDEDEYVSEESDGEDEQPDEPDEDEEEEPFEEEIIPQVVQDIWVQCDECQKWRKMPAGTDESALPDQWYCHMNPDPAMAAQGHAAPQEPDPAEAAAALQPPPPGTAAPAPPSDAAPPAPGGGMAPPAAPPAFPQA